MEKISAVYKIINTVTGDFYVGSSKNVKQRWSQHKRPSTRKRCSNRLLYQDMLKYGLDKFRFQILAPVMEEYLKDVEQEFIDMLQPTYNNYNAKMDIERRAEYNRKYTREFYHSERGKEVYIKYYQSDKGKEVKRKAAYKYNNQLCSYNGEKLTLNALASRFFYAGVEHPALEAKKYLIK